MRILAPGYERLLHENKFSWEFDVSQVREGHDAVSVNERSSAKKIGAKLTFGEVLEPGVALMLRNLGAYNKRILHDLGCGAGKMIIQAFLVCFELKRCMGIELAPGRYKLAERNLAKLIAQPWMGRKFTMIEYKDMEFFKIVEQVPNKYLSVGMVVTCFHPSLRTMKHSHPDYTATIISTHNGLYTVQYVDGRIMNDVEEQYVFAPETVRTLEICSGNLFHLANAWDCDVCILETDFPSEIHGDLMDGMTRTPVGCTFLTYHDLKTLPVFRQNQLRQLDVNVFDSDRYPTSWSQGWRFYLWEHTLDSTKKLEPHQIKYLSNVKYLTIIRNNASFSVQLYNIDEKEQLVYGIPSGGTQIESFNPLHDCIYSFGFRLEVGTPICSYWPHNVMNDVSSQFEPFFGHIDSIGLQGYNITFEDGDVATEVNPSWVFTRPNWMFHVGATVSACWPANAQNKNCPERYRRFPGTIQKHNADGTYLVEFFNGVRANHVREMWLTGISHAQFHEQQQTAVMPPDQDKVYTWDVATVCRWIELLGMSGTCVEEFRSHRINGMHLLRMVQQELFTLNLTKKEIQLLVNKIYRLKSPHASKATKRRY